jgi:adenylate cyclase
LPQAPLLARLRAVVSVPGRLSALLILAILVLARALDPGLVETIILRGFDREQLITPRSYQPSRVRIVAIDDKSLAKYGQWPWPRTLVARLVQRIAAGNPRVLGVDIIFAETDRLSPAKLAETLPDLPASLTRELAALPPNEVALAEAIQKAPTVLGIGAADVPELTTHGASRTTIILESGDNPRPFLIAYPYFLRSLPTLTAAARGQGTVLGNPDTDGLTRRLPLFVVGHGQLAPALAIEMLRVAAGPGSLRILTDSQGVQGGILDGLFIPTDEHGRAYPYFSRSFEGRYISAADVLDPSYNPARLEGGIVLLGVIGQGLTGVRQTPLGLMAAVEVQAQLVECILGGNLLRRPAKLHWIEVALVLVAGLITIFALPYRRPRTAGTAFAIMLVLFFAAGFACFRFFNLLVDSVWPSVASIVSFGVMLGASLRAAEGARRRLAAELEHEHQIEARIEGELNAARSIQMGLLPHRFPGPPEHRDVDLYALIEPARMVGGDLYDFLLLDSRRLFFAIADVSGKGVPAALLMAMTKEVLRAATIQHEEALDRAFAEANARISASSGDIAGAGGDLMFVTVFAGILDLASGLLVYVNAGHDAPFLLRPSERPLELPGEGGPPLGTVDDFPYPVERYQLKPKDLLILFTDGVTEAQNPNDSFYTMARLELLLRSAPTDSAKALVEFVREDLRKFTGAAEQADDITMLAVHWMSPAPAHLNEQ